MTREGQEPRGSTGDEPLPQHRVSMSSERAEEPEDTRLYPSAASVPA